MSDTQLKETLTNAASYYCKNAKFQENTNEANPFFNLSLLRRVTSQLEKLSFLVEDNAVSCQLLSDNLNKYCDLIDDKNGVNSYAEPIQGLVKYFKNAECQKWKSGLKDNYSEFIPINNCDQCKEESQNNIHLFQKAFKIQEQNESICQEQLAVNYLKPSSDFSVNRDIQSEGSYQKTTSYFNNKRKTLASDDRCEPEYLKNRRVDFPKENNIVNKNNISSMNSMSSNSALNKISSRIFKNTFASNDQSLNKPPPKQLPNFRTASAELRAQQIKKNNGQNNWGNSDDSGVIKKSLGSRPRPVTSKFVAPVKSNKNEMCYDGNEDTSGPDSQEECDPRLAHIDPKMIEMIRGEIMDSTNPISWDDIAGLQFAKNTIQEIVVWPMLRPDIFTGLRRPPRGILLFGPPGTGKTLIAKCIASQSKSTFFSISASSLTSKWIGDGEKMVRALFAVARVDQPSVVFIDEIDSLLSKRSDSEHESSRRIKTEFLVQLDGATTGEEDRLLIIGATNRPQELDEAARRRLVKRLYIPLPDHQARIDMVTRLMSKERNNLTSDQIKELADLTNGYSGADVKILCQEAALGPIRSISYSQIEHITSDQVRPVSMDDFKTALTRVRSSVSTDDLQCYIEWDKTYGSGAF